MLDGMMKHIEKQHVNDSQDDVQELQMLARCNFHSKFSAISTRTLSHAVIQSQNPHLTSPSPWPA